jgi:hypothetical protein
MVGVAYAAESKALRCHESCLRELHELADFGNAEWQDALFVPGTFDADRVECALCAFPAVTSNSRSVHCCSGVYAALG